MLNIDDLKQVIAQVKQQLGAISVLINNAASDTRHNFLDVTPEYWDRGSISIYAISFAIQAVYPQMKQLGGGSLINLGSMSWYESQGGMPGYTSSKAAVLGLTRGLARDLGPDKIRVNTLTPGWVMTERQLKYWVNEETARDIEKNQCVKDSLMPEDVAAMALFLSFRRQQIVHSTKLYCGLVAGFNCVCSDSAAFFEFVTTNKGLVKMITGQQLINGQWVQGEAGQYQAVNPAAASFY